MTGYGTQSRAAREPWRHGALVGACLGMVALAAGLRWIALGRGLWLDEYLSVEACCPAGSRGWLLGRAQQMLPYHAALALWGQIDTSVAFLRWPSLVMGVATVGVTMAGVWRCSRRAAVLTGAMLACSPILLRYGIEIRGYGLVIVAAAVAFAIVVRSGSLAHRGWRGALSFALAVALSTHPTAWMLVPALVLADALAHPEQRLPMNAWGRVLALPAAIALCVTLVSVGLQRGALAEWWMPAPTLPVIEGVFRVVAGLDAVASPFTRPFMAILTVVALLGLAVLSWPAPRASAAERRAGTALVAAGACYLVGLVVASLVFPVLWPRTALVALVPTLSGIAVLVATDRQTLVRVTGAVVVGVVCSAWVADWTSGRAWRDVEPWREAASRLERTWRPGDVVVVYPDYVAGPALHYASRIDRASVASIRTSDDAAAVAAKIATALARLPGGPDSRVLAMIRADFTVQRHGRPVDALFAEVAAARRAREIHLLVLTASDIEVEPRLVAASADLEARAAAAIGRGGRRTQLSPLLAETVFGRAGDESSTVPGVAVAAGAPRRPMPLRPVARMATR